MLSLVRKSHYYVWVKSIPIIKNDNGGSYFHIQCNWIVVVLINLTLDFGLSAE